MESLKKQAARLLGEQTKYRRWIAIFLCLALVVTTGTVAALKMNGQAWSQEEKVLTCGVSPDQQVVHVHDESCFGEEGELVCPLPEVEAHVHDESCYQEQMTLICEKEETPIHEHTDACRALVCEKEEAEAIPGHQHGEGCRELICGREVTEGHQHTEGCYSTVQGELICGNTEEGHEHSAECYEQIQSLTCGLEETEAHVHSEECYGPYICGMEESEGVEGHTHTEECYDPYACGIDTEAEGHTHSEECYQVTKVLSCGKLELHTHGADCYGADGSLICGVPELVEHVHSEECFAEQAEEEPQLFQKLYEDTEIRVLAEYTQDAKIPEEAQLVAELIESHVLEEAGDTQEEDAATEIVREEVSYRLSFLLNEETVQPEGNVTFTVQGLDEDGNDAGEPVTLVYNAGDSMDLLVVTLVKETVVEVQHAFCQEAVDGNVRVIAEYDSQANLPEEAKLQIKQITAETDAEHYAVRETELQQALDNEDAIIDTLVNIGFYVDGVEVEPEAPVTIKIQFLNGEGLAVGEPVTVVHFAEQGTEVLSGSQVDEAGTTSFQMDSFSEIVLLGTDVGVASSREISRDTVRFFVNLQSQVLDSAGNYMSPTAEDFTASLFETTTEAEYSTIDYGSYTYPDTGKEKEYGWRIGPTYNVGTEAAKYSASARVVVAATPTATSTGDENVRKLGTPEGVDVNGYTYKLAQFPTDEEILGKLRIEQAKAGDTKKVSVDGKVVSADELTTDNFTVRWYVFKYNTPDNWWHVDGVLVRKQGKLAVTKTFYGNEEAINAVKNGFNITVTEEGKSEPSYKLVLNSKESNPANGTGYDYIAEKDGELTYTWVLGVTASKKFTLKENNYISNTNDNIATLAEYRVFNTKTSSSGTETTAEKWRNYSDAGVEVTVESYSLDLDYSSYQTVDFRNSYLPKNAISIWKIDADSEEGLTGVTFELWKADGTQAEKVYQNGDDYYLYPPTGIATTETTRLQVNGTGHLVLHGLEERSAGEYILKETEHPEGYGAEDVSFTINGNGFVTLKEGSAAVLKQVGDENTFQMNVPNKPGTMDLLIRKEWASGAKKEPVTVELWKGSVKTAYTKELNEENNWQVTISKLPMYVNGTIADYKLREIKIGDTSFDPKADEDGYQFYDVAYEPLVIEQEGTAYKGTLVVRNATDGGTLTFTKTDADEKALKGATFALYDSIEAISEDREVATATSGTNGKVTFIGLTSDTYFMKETKAPAGYELSEKIYKVTFVNKEGTITLYSDGDNAVDASVPLTSIPNEVAKQTIKIVKEDKGGNRLNGAEFTLTAQKLTVPGSYIPTEGGYTSALVDGEEGVVVNQLELPCGTYTLTETNPPEGYYNAQPITLTVKAEGVSVSSNDSSEVTLTASEDGDNSKVWTLTVKNKPGWLDGITLTKVSNEDITFKLGGAAFVLSRRQGDSLEYASIADGVATWGIPTQELATPITTSMEGDDQGTVQLPKLEKGTYFLTEVTAPDGYNLLNHSIQLVVEENENGELILKRDDSEPNATIQGKNITISNSKGIALPETGGPGIAMYTLGGLAIIATSLVYGLSMRRKKVKGGRN